MAVEDAEVLHTSLAAAFEAMLPRVDPASRFERRDRHLVLVCPSLPLPQFNGVWVETPTADDLPLLRTARNELEALGLPFWLQSRGRVTRELDGLVRQLGLGLVDRMPGMVARPDDLRDIGARIAIHTVRDADDRRLALDVAAEAFGIPAAMVEAIYTPAVLATPGLHLYLARAGRAAVSTAIAYSDGRTVGIFNVGTPPAWRGRGFGAAVSWHACAEAFASGARLAWLQASALGEPVYRRLGFRQVETYVLFGPRSGLSATA